MGLDTTVSMNIMNVACSLKSVGWVIARTASSISHFYGTIPNSSKLLFHLTTLYKSIIFIIHDVHGIQELEQLFLAFILEAQREYKQFLLCCKCIQKITHINSKERNQKFARRANFCPGWAEKTMERSANRANCSSHYSANSIQQTTQTTPNERDYILKVSRQEKCATEQVHGSPHAGQRKCAVS